ncbi:MAG: hypothetical protein WD794_16660 [Mycobacteriales bacterium]
MHRPHLSAPRLRAAFHRPAVLATAASLALAALLVGGLAVGRMLDGPLDTLSTADTASSPTPADGTGTTSGGDDNTAVAVNTRDGSTVYAVRLKVVITGAATVDAGNAAVAAASCNDCQTVAIALEGVIVTGDAEVIAPVNLALAVNSDCSNCQTLAYAYQNLQTVDGKVRLTGAGRRGIASLRQQLNTLRNSGLDILQVKAEVDRIAGEFAGILDTEVVPIGPGAATAPPHQKDGQSTRRPATEPAPAPQEAGPSSPEPEPASPSPEPAPTSPSPGPAEASPSTSASAAA